MRTRLPLVLALVSLVAVSGCTTPSAGTPLPATSTQTSADSSAADPGADLPSDGAPKVENPIDASHFVDNPCDALKTEDAKALNLPPEGKYLPDAIGKPCDWSNPETRGRLEVVFWSDDPRGLSSIYREAHSEKWAYFERVDDIEGHPAVAYIIKKHEPRDLCTVAVGLTDRLAVEAAVSLSDANLGKVDPCPLAAKAAGMIMRTVQEAA